MANKQKMFFLSPGDILKQKRTEEKEAKVQRRAEREKKKGTGSRKVNRRSLDTDAKVYDCTTCKLYTKCKSKNIGKFGEGQLGILFVGQAPGRVEDEKAVPFVGPTGGFLRDKLELFGIDLDRDCVRTNVIRCYPGTDEKGHDLAPEPEQVLACRNRLLYDIQEVKPKLIVCLGDVALRSVLQPEYPPSALELGDVHGLTFPIHRYNCWVAATFHPAMFLHRRKEDPLNHSSVFIDDLSEILPFLDRPLAQPLTTEDNYLITDADEAVNWIESLTEIENPVTFDYETNSISPYIADPRLLTISVTPSKDFAHCIPMDYVVDAEGNRVFDEGGLARVVGAWRRFLASSTPKIVQNIHMENNWSMVIFGQEIVNFHYDTMIGAHVLNCRDGTTGLKFQAFRLAGHLYDIGHKDEMQSVQLKTLSDYTCFDSRYTHWAYEDQKARLVEDLELQEFCKLYMSIAPTLSRMKHRGMQLDVAKLDQLQEEFTKVRDEQIATVKALPAVKDYETETGQDFLITSPPQIGKVLYQYMKQPIVGKTRAGRPSANKNVFPSILANPASPEVRTFIEAIQRYRAVEGSGGILKRIEGFRKVMDPQGRVHATLTQNIAKTYRTSATDPNTQNIAEHDKEQRLFRKAIVAEPGRVILHCDKSSLEVRTIAIESGDPTLTYQLENGINFHRDWAIKLYAKSKYRWDDLDLKKKDDVRYDAKNGFVFASFYGSVPESIVNYDAFVEAQIPLEHIIEVQKDFWQTYSRVRAWQNEVVAQYNANGWFRALPGFKRRGPLSLFQLYNNPTQGSGFILFAVGLREVDEELRRRTHLKSYLYTETHDSCDFQAVPDEIPEIVDFASEIFARKMFPWQTISTPVDWEIGESWYSMEKLKI